MEFDFNDEIKISKIVKEAFNRGFNRGFDKLKTSYDEFGKSCVTKYKSIDSISTNLDNLVSENIYYYYDKENEKNKADEILSYFYNLILHNNKLTPMPFIVGSLFLYVYTRLIRESESDYDDIHYSPLENFLFKEQLTNDLDYDLKAFKNDIVLSNWEKCMILDQFYILINNPIGHFYRDQISLIENFMRFYYNHLNIAFFIMLNSIDKNKNIISGNNSILIEDKDNKLNNQEFEIKSEEIENVEYNIFSKDSFDLLKTNAINNYNNFTKINY